MTFLSIFRAFNILFMHELFKYIKPLQFYKEFVRKETYVCSPNKLFYIFFITQESLCNKREQNAFFEQKCFHCSFQMTVFFQKQFLLEKTFDVCLICSTNFLHYVNITLCVIKKHEIFCKKHVFCFLTLSILFLICYFYLFLSLENNTHIQIENEF